jgi:hypothetical protein
MAISSVLNSPNIIGNRKGTAEQFQNFMTGGNGSLGSSIVNSTSLNKIVPFERGGVRPITPDFNSIVSTISTKTDAVLDKSIKNEDNKVQGVINNIQNVFQTTLQNFTKGYQDKLKSIEESKPSKILEKFFGLYNNVTGFIQFFVDKKNLNKTSASLKGLRKLFEDSFEIAKLIRITINKIVNQLSNLPTATPFGGANLTKNATGKVSGGGRGKMLALGAGALGAGMLAGGTINALSGSENLQPAVVQQSIPKDLANSLSSIINRFSNAIDNLIKAAGGTPNSTSKTSGGGSRTSSPNAPPGESRADLGLTGNAPVADVSKDTEFIKEVQKLSKEVGVAPSQLLSMYQAESGINPASKPESGATGIFQLMYNPNNPKDTRYGLTREQFAALSRSDQVKIHRRFLKDAGIKPGGLQGFENVTMANIATGSVGKSPDTPLYKSGSVEYEKNKKIDTIYGNADGVITAREYANFIAKTGGSKKWEQYNNGYVPPQVAAAPTQTKAKADAISKPVNPQAKITTIKMPPKVSSVGGQSQGNGGGGGVSAPPPPSGGIPSAPFLPAGNVDNFLVLYSKMVYNIVDG